ncbi:6-carboxytetrahydropterin synthase [bacterium]|nr:MAG: 6-carboxytetrahydropterin synthase [bacterium]
MPRYRVCKSFTVESGHMLSKHPGACRFPHGHTRKIEVVVSTETLDAMDMVVDFKALKNAVSAHIERYDHAMAINSEDPMLPEIRRVHPESAIVFEGIDPTTEVIAKEIFDHVAAVLAHGNTGIEAGRVLLERVRVWETPSSWAEYGD